MHLKRRTILIGVIIAVILIGFYFLLRKPSDNALYTVKRETLVNNLQVDGTYSVASTTEVDSPTNGVLSEVFVANGAEVAKGDPLFHVQSTATEDEVRTAYAAYLTAKATLDADTALLYSLQSTMYSKWKLYTDVATSSTYENSDSTPKTSNRVLPEFTTAQDNWLAAEANYKNQQGVIAKDQAALSSALLTYQETQSVTLKAMTSGTVVNFGKSLGDEVTASSAVLIIADFRNPTVLAAISEVNVPRIAVGQKATLTFDAFPDQPFTGIIESIDSIGADKQGTIVYYARIDASNAPLGAKPQMTATVTIETLRKENVLTVPNTAITTKDGRNFVTRGGKFIEVTIGSKGLTKTEIVSGLNEGDEISIPK